MSAEAATTPDPNATVSHEQDGRTLSGVGTTAEALAEVMERHAPVEEAPATPSQPAQATEPPKPTRGQARFSELTQARKDAEAKAAAYEKELTELRAKVGAPPSTAPPAPPSSPAPVVSSPSVPNGGDSGRFTPPAPTRQQPSEDEVGTKYKTYAEFVVDSARWVAEQQQADIDARIRSSIEADRATRDFLSHAESTWAKGRKVYADFDAMRTTGPGSQVPLHPEKINAILFHPQSEHLQYAIVKDGALAQRLAQANPIEFGLLLAALAPTAAAAPLASTATSGSITPPAPMQPVGSGSKTTTTPSAEFAAKGDYESYKARRAEERSRGRR